MAKKIKADEHIVLEAAYRGMEGNGRQSGGVLPGTEAECKIVYLLEEQIQAEVGGFIRACRGEARSTDGGYLIRACAMQRRLPY